jgi:hypothetical protein
MERVPYYADLVSQELGDKRKIWDPPVSHEGTLFWKYLARPVTYVRCPENKAVQVYDFRDSAYNPDPWRYCDHGHRVTGEGLVIETPGNTALLMRENMDLDTQTIGSVLIDNTVVDEAGNTPDYEIGFQWADADQVRDARAAWPFHRWRYNAAYPRGDHLYANPYWRGRVSAMSLYFKVKNGEPGRRYTVTLRRVMFFQR